MHTTVFATPPAPFTESATSFRASDMREALSCPVCRLVQFRTRNSLCRRCHKPLDPVDLESSEPQSILVTSASAPVDDVSEVARVLGACVREFRKERGMTQQDLAGCMEVPRTYISKVEMSKAIPTLASLERFAAALGVKVRHLICDARSRRENEIASLFQDEFLGVIARLAGKLNRSHRASILHAAHDAVVGGLFSA